ncbi:MAG: carboxypeptidase-like regulatory domain-containing protein, partial [Myxococcota bacterium]
MKRLGFVVVAIALILSCVVYFWMRRQAPEPEGLPAEPSASDATAVPLSTDALSKARGPRDNRLSAIAELDSVGAEMGVLAGIVLDALTRTPISGAEIVFEFQGGAITERSSEDGSFVLSAKSPGLYRLARLEAPGYVPYAPRWGQSPVVYRATERTRLRGVELFLSPELLYTVRVEEGGEPVAGAEHQVIPRNGAPRKKR